MNKLDVRSMAVEPNCPIDASDVEYPPVETVVIA
jgi:hypothetical protein